MGQRLIVEQTQSSITQIQVNYERMLEIVEPVFRWRYQFLLRKGEDAPENLRKKLLHVIKVIEASLKAEQYSAMVVRSSTYVLASFCDEAIMDSKIRHYESWAQKTLLSILFNETFGGEGVFRIRSYALKECPEMIPVLALIYVSIGLGFRGQYAMKPQAIVRLKQLQNEGLYWLQQYRQKHLFQQTIEGENLKPAEFIKPRFSFRSIALLSLIFLFATHLFMSFMLGEQVKNVAAQITSSEFPD